MGAFLTGQNIHELLGSENSSSNMYTFNINFNFIYKYTSRVTYPKRITLVELKVVFFLDLF